MRPKPHRRIAFVYFITASLWILLSDSILYFLGADAHFISSISMIKGIGFVLVTGAILYVSTRREFDRRFDLEAKLRAQMEHGKQTHLELEQSEQRFRKAVEEAPLPMIMIAEQGEILAISRVWMEITGYTREQLKTLDTWTELAYGSSKNPIKASIDHLFDLTERVDEGEFTITCRDGSQRVWAFRSTPLGRLSDNRRIIVSIANDVTERKQAEIVALENERLKARFQQEQEHNLLVQRIISALSHDLRTPLASILASRETLAYYFDTLSPEKRHERLETIGRQVQFALELVEDTVNLARSSEYNGTLRPSEINIAALCRVSVAEMGVAKNAGHRLKFINLSGTEVAALDEVLVSRILLNLLSNAIKYSPEGTEVRLELDHHESWIVLRVVDQGRGISETDLPHIFEPFYRANNVGSIGGSGLGLSIVKECVERHHGRIQVESWVNRGTTFTVELPDEK